MKYRAKVKRALMRKKTMRKRSSVIGRSPSPKTKRRSR